MGLIKVVCGIIYQGNEIFVCRRRPEKSLGGFWEFPGGKVEEGEESEISLLRELKEELDMDVSVESYFDTSVYEYENFTIELIAYTCQFIRANYILIDHDEYKWVQPEQLLSLSMAPADIPIAQKLSFNTNSI